MKSTENGKRVAGVSKPKHLVPTSLRPILEESKRGKTVQRVHTTDTSQYRSAPEPFPLFVDDRESFGRISPQPQVVVEQANSRE